MNEQQELVEKGKAIVDCCAIEGRTRTPAEERQLGEIHARLKELREQGHQKSVNGFLAGGNAEEVRVDGPTPGGRLGDAFIASKGYEAPRREEAPGSRGGFTRGFSVSCVSLPIPLASPMKR